RAPFQPLGLLSGTCAGVSAQASVPAAPRRSATIAVGVVIAVFAFIATPPASDDARGMLRAAALADTTAERRLGTVIRQAAPSARKMAVWGWMPSLYVETGLVPATRHVVGHFVIDPSPGRSRLRTTLLQDLERERPDVIVDAVAPGCFMWSWSSAERLESFPALAALVQGRYSLASEVALAASQDPVRIYVLTPTASAPRSPRP